MFRDIKNKNFFRRAKNYLLFKKDEIDNVSFSSSVFVPDYDLTQIAEQQQTEGL